MEYLSKKTSKYNSKKIIDQCEICKGQRQLSMCIIYNIRKMQTVKDL